MGPETVDWGYAMSTLLIRFFGIFIVLGILQIVMQIIGRIFTHLDARQKEESSKPSAVASEGLTEEEAAAVSMALYLYDKDA
ncbi:MAG: hypothetical protein BA872_00875 [Desulfobacterales bacterium C00003060]|nr:MAG: hypothetical protein BA861_12845 [Desulfobacterales bacterium S3730MH5]OEU80253.1 MAG: hypothetical protein BA872_00875 [Desulfobacterales bacterium C00003060]OEU83100.1 MAG: hypothetical protein BA865_05560 [Desulfobacterales bacterium S5133MH4]